MGFLRRIRERRTTLLFKIGLILILTLLVLGSVNIFFVTRAHRRMMFNEFSSKGYAIALSLANSSVETLLFHDASSAQAFVDNYRTIDGVAYIYLTNAEGEVIAHTFIPSFPRGLLGTNTVSPGQKNGLQTLRVEGVGDALDVAVPILYGVIGHVHVGMDLGIVDRAVTRMMLAVLWQFGLALVLGIAVIYALIYRLIRPVRSLVRATADVGEGNLRVNVEGGGGDEIGDLSRSFSLMVEHLREAMGGAAESHQAMEEATGSLTGVAEKVREGVRSEQESVRVTEERMEDMKRLSEEIRHALASLSRNSSSTGESATAIHRAVSTIQEGTKQLYGTVESTGSTLSELDATIREISRNVESLREVAVSSASSAQEMDASIKSVDAKTAEVARITGDLEEQFQSGMEAVNRTVSGMEGIRESSTQVIGLIGNLTHSMEAIEKILKLIGDINDQTGLLALNAAIIAAQAGSRGGGFSVVADEMKALSERTDKSAKEIAQMVRGLQKEAEGTVKAVSRTDSQVEESFSLSRRAGQVIMAIQTSVQEVNARIADIARATREQAQLGSAVSRASQDLSLAIERLAGAAVQQATSSAELLKEVRGLKDVAETVDSSVGEQTRRTREIDERMRQMNGAIEAVQKATESQLEAVTAVMGAVIVIGGISGRNSAMVDELGTVIGNLGLRAESLKNELDKFVI